MDAHTEMDLAYAELVAALKRCLASCDPPQEVQPGIYAGMNLPELLSAALEQVCEDADEGTNYLVRHRPGCWEAGHVTALAAAADYRDRTLS